MRRARALVSRARGLMGLHRHIDLARRADDLRTATAENARLDALLEPRVAELEQVVVEVASRRLARDGAAADDPI